MVCCLIPDEVKVCLLYPHNTYHLRWKIEMVSLPFKNRFLLYLLVLQLLFPTWHNTGYCSGNISTRQLDSCCRILLGLTETLGCALHPTKIWCRIWLFSAKRFTAIYISDIPLAFSIIATVANSSLADVGAKWWADKKLGIQFQLDIICKKHTQWNFENFTFIKDLKN